MTRFIGLTGGIGAGKSEALAAFERLGAATLSTDLVAHELLADDEVRDLLIERWGSEVAPGGTIDRGQVAELVFGKPDELAWLESITHPRVGAAVLEWRQRVEPEAKVGVVEVPLLFEAGMEGAFDATVAVVADDEIRDKRLRERGQPGLEGREARQLDQEEKAARADHVVRNDGTLEELEQRLTEVLEELRRIAVSRSRSQRRRPRGRRRRMFRVGAAVLVGLGAGLAIANRDDLEDTIREGFTLPLRHDDIIRQQADEKDVPPDLIAAVIYRESKFSDQTSSAGARGLMQITPTTATEIEKLSGGETFEPEDLSDPDVNISYGTFYLDHLLDRYHGNEVAALAAYNAGPSNAEAWGGAALGVEDIQFSDTREYVEDVLDKRTEYADHYADELGLD